MSTAHTLYVIYNGEPGEWALTDAVHNTNEVFVARIDDVPVHVREALARGGDLKDHWAELERLPQQRL